MLGLRLKHIRESLNISQKNLADLMNIKAPVLSRYESNNVIPTLEILSVFATQFNINLHWLLTGTGSMFLDTPPDNREETAVEIVSLIGEYSSIELTPQSTASYFNSIYQRLADKTGSKEVRASLSLVKAWVKQLKNKPTAEQLIETFFEIAGLVQLT